jgi:uncharacterized protein YgiB involved in biofilm formation
MRRRLSGRKPPLLALGSIAISSMALAGCAGDPPGDVLFTSVDQCITAGMDAQVCQAGYQDAMQAHLNAAPRFDGLAACEAEYGAGQCTEQTAATNNTGGGSFWTPFLAGYVLSSALNNIGDYYNYRRIQEQNGYAYGSTPIYRNRTGQTVTTTRPGNNNTAITPSRQTTPVNVNTRTVVRQGFGGGNNFSFGG